MEMLSGMKYAAIGCAHHCSRLPCRQDSLVCLTKQCIFVQATLELVIDHRDHHKLFVPALGAQQLFGTQPVPRELIFVSQRRKEYPIRLEKSSGRYCTAWAHD